MGDANEMAQTRTSSDLNPSFVLRAVKDVALEDIPRPKITDSHDVIVHIGQTGICGYV